MVSVYSCPLFSNTVTIFSIVPVKTTSVNLVFRSVQELWYQIWNQYNVIYQELWYRLVINICSVVSIYMSGVISVLVVNISNNSQQYQYPVNSIKVALQLCTYKRSKQC